MYVGTVEDLDEAERLIKAHCQSCACLIRPRFHDGGGNLAPQPVTADTPDLERVIREALAASADHAVEIHQDE